MGIRGAMTIALAVIGAVFLFIVCALGFNALTGHIPRAYENQMAPADESIEIAGSLLTQDEAAARYRPVVSGAAGNMTPPLLEVKYEVIDNVDEGAWTIVYFLVWEDEIHPNSFLHGAYWIYRAARYGYPVRDIEYAQIDIEKTTGIVKRIRFESSPDEIYDVANSVHLVDEYTRNSDGTYQRRTSDLDRVEIATAESVDVRFIGTRVSIAVATWNHLSRLAQPSDRVVTGSEDAQLSYLTSSEYEAGKYARKSQGDFKTSEPRIFVVVGQVATIGYALLSGMALVVLFLRLRRAPRGYHGSRN